MSNDDKKTTREEQARTPVTPAPVAPPTRPEDLDLENLDLSVEKVDERISPSETNVFDK